MKICLLSDKYPPQPGGLAISARRLAQGLTGAGHVVHVVAPGQRVLPGQVQCSADGEIHIHRFGPQRRADDTQTQWFELVVDLHRQFGFDLLHGYYLVGAGFTAVYAGRYLNIPGVASARGNDIDRAIFNPNHAGAILWTLTHAAAITTVSQELARKASALAPTCRPIVIHNSVDASIFVPAAPPSQLYADLDLNPASAMIGFVGEARLKKGLTILLPAFAQVAAGILPAPTLLLVGGVRKDDADIARVFQKQNPNLAVRIIPYLDQNRLPDYYNLFDLLVLPSLRDGLPNTLLEGMACGRAVIAGQVGGIPDVISNHENGVLVPPGEVEALAEAMLRLLQNGELRAALGQAARQTVLEKFTLERELEQNLQLYENLLGK
jgi:glycosyltransferase involved in cell wall biosynthesis